MSFQEEVFIEAIINRKTYNTETAEKQGEIFVSVFGDPAGYEESLFKTKRAPSSFTARAEAKANIKRKPSLPDQRAGRAVEKTKRIIKSNRKKEGACRLRSIKFCR